MNMYKLAIAIPSYNRASTLDFFFKIHVPRLQKFNIPVYITNNASTDNTLIILEKWQKIYPHIYWQTGQNTVHADHNVQKALEFAQAEYVWLLGDSYEIPALSFERVIEQLKADCSDIFVLNLADKHKVTDPIEYDNITDVTNEISYLITCISCLIFKKSKLDFKLMASYRATDFGHFGYVMHYISQHHFKLTLLTQAAVVTLKTPKRKKPWLSSYFEIICVKLPKVVFSLPQVYSDADRHTMIKLFIAKSGLFYWRRLMHVRASNNLTAATLKEYKHALQQNTSFEARQLINFISYIPVSICRLILTVVECYRRYSFKIKNVLKL